MVFLRGRRAALRAGGGWLLYFVVFGVILGIALLWRPAGMLPFPSSTDPLSQYLQVEHVAMVAGIYALPLAIWLLRGMRALAAARRRYRALHGDPAALVPAALHLPTVSADEFGDEEVLSQSVLPPSTLRGLATSGIAGALGLCLMLPSLPAALFPSLDFLRFMPSSNPLMVYLVMLVVLLLVAPSWSWGRRAAGIRVGDEGLRAVYARREGPLLRWEEIRLLEVFATRQWLRRVLVFSIHTERDHIVWRDPSQPYGTSLTYGPALDWSAEQSDFFAFVAARTGLTPRTADPRLADGTPWRGLRRRYQLATGAAWPVAAISLVLGIAVVALPLTGISALDITMAVSLAFLAVVVLAISAIMRRARWIWRGGGVPISLPDPIADDESYDILAWLPPRWRLLLIVPVVLTLFDFGASYVALKIWLSPAGPAMGPTSALVPYGIALAIVTDVWWQFWAAVALVACVTFSGRSPRAVHATIDGLEYRRGSAERTSMPWSWVTGLYRVGSAARGAYIVRAFGGREIRWPARVRRSAPIEGDADPITPEELAALVAARTGLPLRIKSE